MASKMDLVDIDKVLDNLELLESADEQERKEQQNQEKEKLHQAQIQLQQPHQQQQQQQQQQQNANNHLASNNSNIYNTKNFVGVSQLFSSLDDYRKNVQTLETVAHPKYDIECHLPSSTSPSYSSTSQSSATNTASASATTITTTTATTTTMTNRSRVINDTGPSTMYENQVSRNNVNAQGDDHHNDDDDDDDDDGDDDGDADVDNGDEDDDDDFDDEEASNDINKFTEKKSRMPGGRGFGGLPDEDVLTSAESLTTSSASTFSSGPSAGVGSSSEDAGSPIMSVNDNNAAPRSTVVVAADENTRIEENSSDDATNATVEAARSIPNTNTVGLDDASASLETGDLNVLAADLSSISISNPTALSHSILPCEASASSVLNHVLNELSEGPTTSSLNDDQTDKSIKPPLDESRIESESVVVASESEAAKMNPEQLTNEIAKENSRETQNQNENAFESNKNKQQQQQEQLKQQQQQQEPITFASTMDEISDTELDSMLQEMDIEESEENCGSQQKTNLRETDTELTSEKSNDCKNLESNQIDVQVSPEESEEFINSKEQSEDMQGSIDLEANDDSFSQASTVEFSEIRTTNSSAVPIPKPQEHEKITESVDEESNKNEPQMESSLASSYTSTDSTTSTSSLNEMTNNREERNNEEALTEECLDASQLKPQRPTTLDLPALKASLYANAGQTPPGDNTEVTPNVVPSTDQTEINATNNEAANIDDPNQSEIAEASGYSDPHENLGRIPPIWVPDNMATACMQCQAKFTMIKRRHHCRACGKVLCSLCCSQKFKLEFVNEPESRVCVQCYLILSQRDSGSIARGTSAVNSFDGNGTSATANVASQPLTRSPNPNNPMEYCSTIPPHRQVSASASSMPPPSVIVPVGVLKKDNSHSSNSSNSSTKQQRKRKSVMFSDGIGPGSDLANMEQQQWGESKQVKRGPQSLSKSRGNASTGNKPPTPGRTDPIADPSTLGLVAQLFRGSIPPTAAAETLNAASSNDGKVKNFSNVNSSPSRAHPSSVSSTVNSVVRTKKLPPSGSDEFGCFIPKSEDSLPPLYIAKDESGCDFDYKEIKNNFDLLERLQSETLKFAVTQNFFVLVKIAHLKCCMSRTVINFTTNGMHHVGNDEIIILLECDIPSNSEAFTDAEKVPKDIFTHLYEIYRDAERGNPISELSYTSPQNTKFLNSYNYGGFIYIRNTFQCLQEIILPENPFLIGILIQRQEVPWARVFPLRLMLRLGAQYRYYPCPQVSIRKRDSVYAEIAQTIINFLADFRNYSYTLPCIRGMYIHMEDRQTTVLIPRNRQEDVNKAINNSSDHILAFGGNFSKTADGHLVCMQNVHDERTELYSYSTQAINIQGQPRKITGANFFVLNESLKTSSGLSGKCSIVEDGLMVQILPTKMEEIRNALRNQKDIDIVCGPINAEPQQTEVFSIKWVENDRDFNIGVKSPIDEKSFQGISSMRVHASFNYANANYAIRLTDIYILKFEEWYKSSQTSITNTSTDITRISEQVARSASMALVPFLDLLAANGNLKIGLRVTLHQDSVCYEAGARGVKLPPLYMNALDNHLIPTLHNESNGIEDEIILELVFYILNV